MANTITKPTKAEVRGYIAARLADRTPPPSMEEIRRRLGWHLIEAERMDNASTPGRRHRHT